MAYASVFFCQKTPHVSQWSLTSLTCVGSPTCRRNLHIPRGKDVVSEPIFGTSNKRICISHQMKPKKGPTLAVNSDDIYETHSLSDVVKKFYICINEDDRKGLEDLISSNCRLEDSAFPYIIQGKKEVMSLLIQLAESMGANVQFKLGTVCEGEELTASVNWHLEWKEDQIPFSKGCSTFQCSNEGDRLLIRKVQNITESPVKPGILAMALLKIVRSLFDEFPKPAKWFLKSPHIILQAVLNIYGLFLAPIINPILTFYITLWKIIARTLGYAMSFLRHGNLNRARTSKQFARTNLGIVVTVLFGPRVEQRENKERSEDRMKRRRPAKGHYRLSSLLICNCSLCLITLFISILFRLQ